MHRQLEMMGSLNRVEFPRENVLTYLFPDYELIPADYKSIPIRLLIDL